jgi:hypothetical protein
MAVELGVPRPRGPVDECASDHVPRFKVLGPRQFVFERAESSRVRPAGADGMMAWWLRIDFGGQPVILPGVACRGVPPM